MSSPNQGGGQPIHQTILESFTRCFNPVEGHSACTKLSTKSDAQRKSNNSSPSSQLFGLNFGSGEGGGKLSTRAVSRSSSSSDSRKKAAARLDLNVSYDADGVAKAKKSAHHRMTAEALDERSMKRKLEIFRGTGQEQASRPPMLAPRHRHPPSSSREASVQNGSGLALSDDEEELIRLTSSRKRFACGMNMDRIQNNSPISSVARLFNFGLSEAQKPFGLCFATPVRTASQENIANLSDDKLTADEFLRRHGGNVPHVSPDVDVDRSSYCEEETISSTLYFDQKYSHLVQTRPPMPLFQENMLSSTEMTNDELSNIIKRRRGEEDSPPVQMITKDRHSPKRVVSSSSAGRGDPFRSSKPSIKIASRDYSSNPPPPSPVRIRDESLSINNTQSAEELMMLTTSFTEEDGSQVPKLLSPTAAEI